jgi:hypothetical protein
MPDYEIPNPPPKLYPHDRYSAILQYATLEIGKLAQLKGGEYAGDFDRLANFRRNGERLGVSMETVWAVYCNKHMDAILQFIQDRNNGVTRTRLEGLDGRAMDVMVYMTLFLAMLDEASPLPEVDKIMAARRAVGAMEP